MYRSAGIQPIVVGDENFGEGSSREHAAMEPRLRGVKVVLVKSFARIHETNLKKQGILALTFNNKSDYDKILEDDRFNIIGVQNILESIQNNLDKLTKLETVIFISTDKACNPINLYGLFNDSSSASTFI